MDVKIYKSIPLPSHDMLWLGFFYFTISCGHLIWRSTIYNYGISDFNISPEGINYLFSIAAIPGLLTIVLGFLIGKINLLAILIMSYSLMGIGLIVVGQSDSWNTVLGGVFLLNFGLAIAYPMSSGFCLNRTPAAQTAISLGTLKSLGPAAAFVSIPLLKFLLPLLGVRDILSIIGCITIATGMLITPFAIQFGEMRRPQQRIKFRPYLLSFYILNFLNGSRSVLFKAFVIIYLVDKYELNLEITASIVICGYILNYLGYIIIGPIVESIGQRKVLQCVYFLVALIFLGFSSIESKYILISFYFIDSFLFCTSVVTDAHLKSHCPERDYVGQLSAGVSLFYFAGFIIPAFGNLLFIYFGYPGPFGLGAIFAFIAIIMSQRLESKTESISQY